MTQDISAASDEALWRLRLDSRRSLVNYVRRLYARQLADGGVSPEEQAEAALILDPDILTLGFARRFATYKRPDLLLHNPSRLLNILNNQKRPVQLVLAGKAHPQDVVLPSRIPVGEFHVAFPQRPKARNVVSSGGSNWVI